MNNNYKFKYMPITKEHKSLLRKLYDIDQIPRHIKTLDNLENEFRDKHGFVNVAVLFRAGEVIQSLQVHECVSEVLFGMLRLIAQIDWEKDIIWDNTVKDRPRLVISNLYYDAETKKNNFNLWMQTFYEGIGSLEDFYQKYLSDFIPTFEMFQSTVNNAKDGIKGCLIYTDEDFSELVDDQDEMIDLPQDPTEAVDKIINELGESYAWELLNDISNRISTKTV